MDVSRLQSRLESLGMTPNAASVAAGLGRDYVRDIIRGKAKFPTAERLLALARVLECSPDYLLGVTPELGDQPADSTARLVFLPVLWFARRGYFATGVEPRMAYRRQLANDKQKRIPVVSAVVPGESEWLALVSDASQTVPLRTGQQHFPRGSFVHVVSPNTENRHLEFALVEERREELLQRTIKIVESGENGVRFYPELDRPVSGSWRSFINGEEGVTILGMIVRFYKFFDARSAFLIGTSEGVDAG